MLTAIIFIFGIFLTIFFVIVIHEFAHFIVARSLNIKVLRFSIGFGKVLYKRVDKKGTEYVFSLIPLGGYIKMLDEGEGAVAPADLPYAFNRQPLYKKAAVVMAGPLSNLLTAFCIYWLLFMVGFTAIVPVIGKIAPHSIAFNAGLKPQQEIVSIDNHATKNWMSVILRIFRHAGDEDTMLLKVKSLDNKILQSHTLNLAGWELNELKPDPLTSLGITPYEPVIPLVIGFIAENSPAAQSPLKVGDKILTINNMSIIDWTDALQMISTHPEQSLLFTVERKGQKLSFPVFIGAKRTITFSKKGQLGIAPNFEWPKELTQKVQYGPGAAFLQAGQETADFFYMNWIGLKKLLQGKISLQSLGGPITIFESAGNALTQGLISFLSFIAFLSIAIAFINFLPIPGLDGGHLLFYIIEFIIQRPLSQAVQLVFYRLGLILLFLLIIQAVSNDLLRL